MMSMQDRDMAETRIHVSSLERDHLVAYIEELRIQRTEASPLEADYLADVIHALTRRLTRLECNIAQHTKALEVDRWDRQHQNVVRIH